jgi:hypothetical protein
VLGRVRLVDLAEWFDTANTPADASVDDVPWSDDDDGDEL